MQLSHRYKLNTDVEFHVHNTVLGNNAGNVRWQLKVSYADIAGSFNNTATFLYTQVVAANSLDDHLLADISGAVANFAGVSGFMLCNLTRLGADVLDTYTGATVLVGLDAHIEIDTMGSRTETTK